MHAHIFFSLYLTAGNPPFNLSNWRTATELTNDARWKGYEVPPVSNANYAWILHMLSRLSYNGTAAFLLANGALSAEADEYKIRKQLIENNKIEAIIVLPRDMFYATDISVTLWIVGNHKKPKTVKRNDKEITLRDRSNEILFIDARTLGDGGNNDDGYVHLTEEDKVKISSTLFAWQSPEWEKVYKNMPEFCCSVGLEDKKDDNGNIIQYGIKSMDYSLAPSKYIEFVNRDEGIDFEKEMSQIQAEMRSIMAEEHHSQKLLHSAFEGIGYGIE